MLNFKILRDKLEAVRDLSYNGLDIDDRIDWLAEVVAAMLAEMESQAKLKGE